MRDVTSVREVMMREFVGVSESDDLEEVARLLASERDGPAVVVRGRDPVGTVTRADALAALLEGEAETVADAMSGPLPSIDADERATAARASLVAADSTHLLVVGDEEPVGVIGADDLLGVIEGPQFQAPSGATDPDLQDEPSGPMDDRGGDDDVFGTEADGGETSTQSICEVCGSLAMDLQAVNGNMLCPDCRDV